MIPQNAIDQLESRIKIKWTKYCALTTIGNNNANANSNNIIFTIKDTNSYLPVVTLSPTDNQKLL